MQLAFLHNSGSPPTHMPMDQADGGSSSVEGLSSQVVLACVMLAKTYQHRRLAEPDPVHCVPEANRQLIEISEG